MNNKTNILIDLDKLKNNINILTDTYGDYEYFLANLKNNAFGLGYNIIDILEKNNINLIYVSTLNEALEIRKINHNIPILINFDITEENIYDASVNNISITISNINNLEKISSLNLKDSLNIHLLIDNGTNKIGLKNKEEVNKALDIINNCSFLNLKGVYTEFLTYGIIDDDYYEAYDNFLNIISIIPKDNLIIHVNEPCMYHRKNKDINALRFDLSLFGIEENVEENFVNNMKIKSIERKYNNLLFPNINLNLVFRIESEIMSLAIAKENTLVGRSYWTKEKMDLAIIPIGYKDGITKALNKVVINNKEALIIDDEIDYLIVKCPFKAQVGDKVDIISEDTNIYEVISLLKTNRYYLMSILTEHLNKIYLNIPIEHNLL